MRHHARADLPRCLGGLATRTSVAQPLVNGSVANQRVAFILHGSVGTVAQRATALGANVVHQVESIGRKGAELGIVTLIGEACDMVNVPGCGEFAQVVRIAVVQIGPFENGARFARVSRRRRLRRSAYRC